jgi:hypothetical protein
MSVNAQTITVDENHAGVQNLRGWSLRGTFVIRLRAELVTGQILGTIENDSHELFPDIIDAPGGTYVEVVSGVLTEGILYYT